MIDARHVLERRETVINASDVKTSKAAAAARAVTEARAEWVRGGCQYSAAREVQRLENVAAEAARAAERAALNAAAVGKQLARAEEAVRDAQSEVRSHDPKIAGEIGRLISEEEVPPLLAQFQRASEHYMKLFAQLLALHNICDPYGRGDGVAHSADGFRLVNHALDQDRLARAAALARPPQDDALMARWRSRAEALRKDPDA